MTDFLSHQIVKALTPVCLCGVASVALFTGHKDVAMYAVGLAALSAIWSR